MTIRPAAESIEAQEGGSPSQLAANFQAMTDITNRVLPEPKNWQDFERLCFDLYRYMWKTNDAEMNGRQGQPQSGVDV